jgi:NAD(P)-dependent dehydrogenase (short-subunit alcohol dehydrogenase family)
MALKGLAGKVAVVTGAAGGIGEGVARRLAEEGASVVVVDIQAERVQAVADSLGESATAVDADVSVESGVERYTGEALERFGRIDLYHLNAAISGSFAPFAEVTTEDWDRTIAVNLTSVFLGLRAALRQFEAQGSGGAVVTTASMAGLQGSDSLVPYTAAKHAVIGLTRCAALAGAPLGVRVNCVAPGMIMTPLWDDFVRAIGEESAAQARRVLEGSAIPLGRFGTPEEAGALVAFLLSDDASYVSGDIIPLAGGANADNFVRGAVRAAALSQLSQ